MAESFFSRFKTEIDTGIFGSVEEARSTAFDYIECYYNRVRRHTTLGTTIPNFEQQLKAGCGNMEKPKAAFPKKETKRVFCPKNLTGSFICDSKPAKTTVRDGFLQACCQISIAYVALCHISVKHFSGVFRSCDVKRAVRIHVLKFARSHRPT